jgi:hypothetical protein
MVMAEKTAALCGYVHHSSEHVATSASVAS